MAVGRAGDHPGGKAIGVLNLDSPAPQLALDQLSAIDAIERFCSIELPKAGQLPPWLRG